MEGFNWLSIVISTLIPTVVGFIWYNPHIFGEAWRKSIGMTKEQNQKGNIAVMIGVGLVMSFLLSFFLLGFAGGPDQEGAYDTFKHGAFHGVFVALLVGMPVLVTNALAEQRNFKTMAINMGYWIITMALMSGVLDAMNHNIFALVE